jgi:hypothetical protein
MDEILKEAIESSGYYSFLMEPFDLTLRNENMNYMDQVALVLAREVVKFRPDLLQERNQDIVYVVSSESGYSLPSSDLTSLLETEKPFDDAVISTYSLSERKLIKKLYKGDGVKWIPFTKGGRR